jgi:probable phosphoglycerate mutase
MACACRSGFGQEATDARRLSSGAMPPGRILLARHGETAATRRGTLLGRRELPLTGEGRRQAERLAEAVADTGLVRLYSSPSGRTLETAAIVGARLGLEPVVDERLLETDKGRWAGRSRAEIKVDDADLYRVLRKAPDRFRYPGGEALVEHQHRVRDALAAVARGPLPALVVCHVGTIRVALALGLPGGLAAAREVHVPNAVPIPFDERLLTGTMAAPR